jgi:hypothetical protein
MITRNYAMIALDLAMLTQKIRTKQRKACKKYNKFRQEYAYQLYDRFLKLGLVSSVTY